MANEYMTATVLKDTLNVAGTTYLDANIASALEAASRAVDLACDKRRLRRFWKDGSPTTRRYTPVDPYTLAIHDAVDDDSFALATDEDADGTFETVWTRGRDYELFPLNATAEERAVTHIQINRATTARIWRSGRIDSPLPTGLVAAHAVRIGYIQVTAHFGWPSVPPSVSEATGMLATRLLKRKREAPFGVVGFGMDQAAAVHIARTDPDVAGLLEPFMRRSPNRTTQLG